MAGYAPQTAPPAGGTDPITALIQQLIGGGQAGGVTAQPIQPPQRPLIQTPAPAVQPQTPADPAHPPVIGHPQTQPAPANTNALPAGMSPDIMAMVKSLPPELQAAYITKFANDQRLEQALVDKQNQQSKLVDAMLADRDKMSKLDLPADPALRAPPPTPDIQPIKAFQNWGVALAMLGSLLTRRPLTAALKSGAAAMKAYNEGRWNDYYAARAQWKDSVDVAMKQNELEYRRYEAAREKYGDDLDKLTLAYRSIADEYGDKVALHDIENGQMDDFLNMRKQLLDEQYRYAALNYRYHLAYGGMTPAQRVHDQAIQDARKELKDAGLDWQNPNMLSDPKMVATGGIQTPQQRRWYADYVKANQPLYDPAFDLPGVPQESPGQPIPITPEMGPAMANAPDGKRLVGPDGKVWVKHGNSLVPTGETPTAADLAAATPATAQ